MKLKEWRQNENISAAEFGRRIGVSHAAVLRWEAGTRMPRRAQLASLERETGGKVTFVDFYPSATPQPERAA